MQESMPRPNKNGHFNIEWTNKSPFQIHCPFQFLMQALDENFSLLLGMKISFGYFVYHYFWRKGLSKNSGFVEWNVSLIYKFGLLIFGLWLKKVKLSHCLIAEGAVEVGDTLYHGHSILKAEPIPLLSPPYPPLFRKRCSLLLGWQGERSSCRKNGNTSAQSYDLPTTFCTITERLQPLDYGASLLWIHQFKLPCMQT